MKTVMSAAISFALLGTTCFSQNHNDALDVPARAMYLPSPEVVYESIGNLKDAYSTFSCEWLEFASGGQEFVICLITLPAYGSSNHTVRGWSTDSDGTMATMFLDFLIRDLGAGKLEFSRLDMRLSLKGTANNKFRDVIVLQLDLR